MAYNEGCLSIPKIREDVIRDEEVTLEYVDENFQPHTNTFTWYHRQDHTS